VARTSVDGFGDADVNAGELDEHRQAWRRWLHELGARVRDLRELLGLSQEQVARIAKVSQGAVSRFERGDALSTPWIVAVKIRVALAARIQQLAPDVLTDEARRFLAQTALYGLPGEAGLPPRIAGAEVLPAPELTAIVRAYRRVPEAAREQFVAIMAAVGTTLADRNSR
jgi:transcriptional regulator with XRE-family HTH domain